MPTLTKEERLHGKSDIEKLLVKGRSGDMQVMKYRFLGNTGSGLNRIMVSVSKRLFKRAVKRNLLKRRIRESYRLQKHLLPSGGNIDILFIYNTKEVLPFDIIYNAVGRILERVGNGQKKD